MDSTIVVPVDGSAASERVLPVALALARARGARIELLTVVGERRDVAAAERHRRLTEVLPAAQRGAGTVVLSDGPVAEEIAAAGAGGALVCMAATGRGHVGELAAGSVVADVVQRATRPLVLVGPGCTPAEPSGRREGRAVAALAGRPGDAEVVAAAAEWAEAADVEVALVHVVAGLPARAAADRLLDGARSALVARGVRASASRGEGEDPAPVLLDAVTPADVLLVGSPGPGPAGRRPFATTAMWLVHRAPCPLVVVPPAEHG